MGRAIRVTADQCAGQTYLDLYGYDPAPEKIAHIQVGIDNMVNSAIKDDWYWVDALQMGIYRPIVEKAWNGKARDAVHPDGKPGYVQASAADPCDHFPVDYEDTTDFGVGAFLLAGSQVVKMATGPWPTPSAWYSFKDWTAVHDLGPGHTGRLVVAFEITPADTPADGLAGYADSARVVDRFDDMTVNLRMFDQTQGFEAHDGD